MGPCCQTVLAGGDIRWSKFEYWVCAPKSTSPFIPSILGWQKYFACAIVMLFRVLQHNACCTRGWASVGWSHSSRFHVPSSLFTFKSNLPIWCTMPLLCRSCRSETGQTVCFITEMTFWIMMFSIIKGYINAEICEQFLFWTYTLLLFSEALKPVYPTGCMFSTVFKKNNLCIKSVFMYSLASWWPKSRIPRSHWVRFAGRELTQPMKSFLSVPAPKCEPNQICSPSDPR